VGETIGSAWIGACCDAVLGGTVDVTTGPYCGEACRDADVICGVACRDTVLGGTMGVTTGPFLHVINIVGETVKASTGLDSTTCTKSELVASTLKE